MVAINKFGTALFLWLGLASQGLAEGGGLKPPVVGSDPATIGKGKTIRPPEMPGGYGGKGITAEIFAGSRNTATAGKGKKNKRHLRKRVSDGLKPPGASSDASTIGKGKAKSPPRLSGTKYGTTGQLVPLTGNHDAGIVGKGAKTKLPPHKRSTYKYKRSNHKRSTYN